MFDYENVVAEIELKVGRLIEENHRLQETEQNLIRQCKTLQEQIDNNNLIIKNLKEQNNILKLGNVLSQEGNSTEIKLKINQLIRSIDKSLSLINKTE